MSIIVYRRVRYHLENTVLDKIHSLELPEIEAINQVPSRLKQTRSPDQLNNPYDEVHFF